MKILILDQNSQVGHALAELLQGQSQAAWRGVPASLLAASTAVVEDIIVDYAPDFIVNACSIELSESPVGVQKNHVKIIRSLCRVAQASDTVFVHVSNAQVFNGCRGKLFRESDRPKPKGRVSRRLAELEQTVIRHIDHHIILRSGWVFGVHGRGTFHGFLRRLELGREISMQSAIEAAPTPAADVARVLFAMMQQLDCGAHAWGVYHYGSSDITSSRDFSETVITMAAQYGSIDIEHVRLVERRSNGESVVPHHPILECSKILDTFGIKQRPWRSAMTSILKDLYREQHTGEQSALGQVVTSH